MDTSYWEGELSQWVVVSSGAVLGKAHKKSSAGSGQGSILSSIQFSQWPTRCLWESLQTGLSATVLSPLLIPSYWYSEAHCLQQWRILYSHCSQYPLVTLSSMNWSNPILKPSEWMVSTPSHRSEFRSLSSHLFSAVTQR